MQMLCHHCSTFGTFSGAKKLSNIIIRDLWIAKETSILNQKVSSMVLNHICLQELTS
jgi:hypothetical protein